MRTMSARLTIGFRDHNLDAIVVAQIPARVIGCCTLTCEACATECFDVEVAPESSFRSRFINLEIRLQALGFSIVAENAGSR